MTSSFSARKGTVLGLLGGPAGTAVSAAELGHYNVRSATVLVLSKG